MRTSHGPSAEKAGVAPAIVEVIRAGAAPDFDRGDEATCYRFCAALVGGQRADDALWAESCAAFSERGVNKLLGLHTSACLTMVGYQMPTKNGQPDPLP